MRRSTIALAAAAAVMVLAACGEKPQTIGQAAKKDGGQVWQASQSSFQAAGWTPGDKASWEAQMRARAQGQNEYSRIAAVATTAQ
jgi:predicted small lipoprotein YifL